MAHASRKSILICCIGGHFLYYFSFYLLKSCIHSDHLTIQNTTGQNTSRYENSNSSWQNSNDYEQDNVIIMVTRCLGFLFSFAAILYVCFVVRCRKQQNETKRQKETNKQMETKRQDERKLKKTTMILLILSSVFGVVDVVYCQLNTEYPLFLMIRLLGIILITSTIPMIYSYEQQKLSESSAV